MGGAQPAQFGCHYIYFWYIILLPVLFVYRLLWPFHLVLLLVCCLYKEVYLQMFKCVSFWLHGCCGEWEGWARKPVNYTNSVALVNPNNRHKSVPQCYVIEIFVAFFVFSLYPFDISVGIGAFVTGWSKISSFVPISAVFICIIKVYK